MTTTIDSLPPPARTASRPSVSYREYVRDFARMTTNYIFLASAGMASIAGAMLYVRNDLLMIVAIAGGLGMALGGLAGVAAAAAAHNSYTRLMATSVTTTYQAPPPVETVRPFVASRNAPRTVRAGRIALPASTWAALFETAASNGGRLTRDGAIKAGLPRDLYHANWQETLGELKRLGIAGDDGALAPDARRLLSPYPEDAQAQPFVHTQNERERTAANG